jgi:methyl-accepting chemotaxis protein
MYGIRVAKSNANFALAGPAIPSLVDSFLSADRPIVASQITALHSPADGAPVPSDLPSALEESQANTRAVIHVIREVNEKTTPKDVMASTLAAVKEAFGYGYGACWMIDKEEQHTNFAMESGSLGPAFDRVNRETHYEKGQGLTGKTWAAADVLFIPALREVPNSRLVEAACAAGVVSAVSFPFIVANEVYGVFFFFSFQPLQPSPERLDTLRNIGRLVGQAFGRLLDLEKETQEHNLLRQRTEQMLMVVEAAHRGDLTQAIPFSSEDALGQVAQALGTFLSDLRASLRRIMETAQELNAAAQALDLLSRRMREQSEQTAETAASVTGESQSVSLNLESIAGGSREMLTSINGIVESASHAAADVQAAVRSANMTREEIEKLVNSGAEIGGAIKVIDAIARQTRLLALNASIEAARAGSAGLGFTVVANEVKQLAAGTATATSEIAEKIEAIQQNTARAGSSIAEIVTVIEKINRASLSIRETVEAQAVTTRDIGANVNEAAQRSSSIASKIGNLADVANDAQKEAAETQIAAKTVSTLAAELRGLVARFTV